MAAPLPPAKTTLEKDAENQWTLVGGWKLAEAPKVSEDGADISKSGFQVDKANWMAATVPGTVLTTMIDRGMYPDPDYGLNNLAIPESLNKQDYWYRSEFSGPKESKSQRYTLVFDGINYAADVWLNGHELGMVKGAFIRGTFCCDRHSEAGRSECSGGAYIARRRIRVSRMKSRFVAAPARMVAAW